MVLKSKSTWVGKITFMAEGVQHSFLKASSFRGTTCELCEAAATFRSQSTKSHLQ